MFVYFGCSLNENVLSVLHDRFYKPLYINGCIIIATVFCSHCGFLISWRGHWIIMNLWT